MNPVKQVGIVLCGLALAAAATAADEPAGVGIPASPAGADGAAGEAAAALSPARQYALAHESLTQADWLKQQGMGEEAFDLYSEARNLFQQLAAAHPGWETKVVAFRIKYCTDEMARLRPAATTAPGASNAAPAAARAPAATAVPAGRPELVRRRPDSERDEGGPPAPPRASPPLNQAEIAKLTEHMRAGLQKERAADLKGALEHYLTVLEAQPRNTEAIKGAARCCLRAGLTDDARDLLERGMKLPDPDDELNLLTALVFCRDKEFHKAYQLLIIVLNDQPANALAHLAMGVAQAGLDKLDEARVETQKAIQLDPKLGDAYYNLACISLKLKPSSPGIARGYYVSAIRYGAAPDPALAKQLP